MKNWGLGLCGGVALVAVVAATGCGSSGSATPEAATTTSSTAAASSNGGRNTAAFQKFTACMKKQGVDVNGFGRGPGGGTPPTGNPPAGGAGTANGRPQAAANPKFRAALTACRSVAPQGFGNGARPGGAANNQQFQKFTACMKSHGVTLPSGGQQTTKPIDRNSATYKKASAACSNLLPGSNGNGTQGG